MQQAERIAINEHKSTKIAVISGVGTRNYYRKLGYELEGPYVVKSLEEGVYKSALDCYDGRDKPLPKERVPIRNKTFLSTEEFIKKWHQDNPEWKIKYRA